MPPPLVIGSGPNSLAAAYYLARAGLAPIVFERSDHVGGGAITGELHPGFRCPTLSHEVLVHAQIVRDRDLRGRGVELFSPDVEVCAPSLAGAGLVIHADPARAMDGLRAAGEADARAWPEFRASMTRVASALAPVFATAPPDLDHLGAGDVLALLGAGRRFRGLGSREGYRLLRWLPMPVADLVDEWFRHEPLRAMVAAPALSATMLGPRSAGSGLVLLLREVHRVLAGGRSLRVRGGPGALTGAMADAARAAGATIHTGSPVERLMTHEGRIAGLLVSGRQIDAGTVVSGADPRTTLLSLLDGLDLTPSTATNVRNYRAHGTLAKVNLALSSLPSFAGIHDRESLAGRIHIGPSLDYMERAFDHVKYGELSEQPWLDVTIPSLLDPQLAPAGAHVASIYVHCAPCQLRRGDWGEQQDVLLQRALAVLERHAPGVSSLIVATEVITPAALRDVFGYAGGHVFHGELAPDQLFTMRPLIGYSRYETPIKGLYLCGAGTHPGGFLTGASGRLAAAQVLRQVLQR
jgi:phytoene dehydrogenase-like protein